MAKVITAEELNNRIDYLQKDNDRLTEQIKGFRTEINKGNKMYKSHLNKCYKEIEKNNNEIKKLEYQIDQGCRQLKSALAISKDLIAAGFTKGVWNASSQVRGWGHWNGQFTVKDNSTYITVEWLQKTDNKYFEDFKKYLIEKYQDNITVDQYNNITISK